MKVFNVKLELTAQEMDIVFAGLNELPRKQSGELFDKLMAIGKQQYQDFMAENTPVPVADEAKAV